jgi:hypothetical protein
MRPNTNIFLLILLALFLPGTVTAAPLELVTRNLQDLKVTPVVKLSYPVKLPNTEAFCAALGETKKQLSEGVAAKEKRVSEYIDGLAQQLEDERNGRDAKLEEARSEADQKRSEWYARLEDRAKGDDQKDAVVKYKQRVEEAVDDRRDAVDAAIAEFRKSVDELAVKRSTSMQTARDTFRASTEAAAKKLETDCANGVATDVVVKDFKASLKAGREKLAADKKAVATLESEIKILAEVRKKSIAAAVTTFQAELQAANEDLQASFTGGE